ncbi:MAG: sulfur transferase domain-containing protein [Pseudomonadota bacterium]
MVEIKHEDLAGATPDAETEGSAADRNARRRPSDQLPSYPVRPDPLLTVDPGSYEDPAKRAWAEKRLRRINRWRRPLTRKRDRLRAWANMLIVDHGFIRAIYPNRWQVTPRMWRSAQPLPHHIHQFAEAGGRTVVTLRGGQMFGSLPLEAEACAEAGLEFNTIVLRSRDVPAREELLGIVDALEGIETPVLFHCKSGADRAGFMAALWLMMREGRPVEEAQAQLALRYGHIRASKTGVLDYFFEVFATETAPGGPADGLSLRDWIATRFDREALREAHRASGVATVFTDVLLRRE